jgi:hypothetical protein
MAFHLMVEETYPEQNLTRRRKRGFLAVPPLAKTLETHCPFGWRTIKLSKFNARTKKNNTRMNTKIKVSLKKSAALLIVLVALMTSKAALGQGEEAAKPDDTVVANGFDSFNFKLVRSKGLPAGVLPNAHGIVNVTTFGTVEVMTVTVAGLPANTDFDFFIIQKPGAPFGLSWYQGDITTNKDGVGSNRFIGRFNIETFIVSPGAVAAPVVFHNAFPDSDTGVTVGRIHTYHCGLWFNSPSDGAKAGASGTTPFNGEGNAGVQVLNTSQFADLNGPLDRVN